jgi:hypothetical protein
MDSPCEKRTDIIAKKDQFNKIPRDSYQQKEFPTNQIILDRPLTDHPITFSIPTSKSVERKQPYLIKFLRFKSFMQ